MDKIINITLLVLFVLWILFFIKVLNNFLKYLNDLGEFNKVYTYSFILITFIAYVLSKIQEKINNKN